MKPESLGQFAVKTFHFLNKTRIPYLLIGGLAASVAGEPRFTYDIDVDIAPEPKALQDFLARAKEDQRIYNAVAGYLNPKKSR